MGGHVTMAVPLSKKVAAGAVQQAASCLFDDKPAAPAATPLHLHALRQPGGPQRTLRLLSFRLTGECIAVDMLTAPLWNWLAADESHAQLSQNPAGIVQVTGSTYGLFHAMANPIYSWGVARRVTFPNVNIDIASHR